MSQIYDQKYEKYNIINLSDIVESKKLDQSAVINYESLVKAGMIRKNIVLLKILGDGELKTAINIEANKFSASAEKKIIDAGGKITVL